MNRIAANQQTAMNQISASTTPYITYVTTDSMFQTPIVTKAVSMDTTMASDTTKEDAQSTHMPETPHKTIHGDTSNSEKSETTTDILWNSIVTDPHWYTSVKPSGVSDDCNDSGRTVERASGQTRARNSCEQSFEDPAMPGTIDLFLGLRVDECYDFECGSELSNCLCDPECLLYGDCCYEYIEQLLRNKTEEESEMADFLENRTALYHSIATNNSFAKELFIFQHSACIFSDTGLNSYWMISKCPDEFTDEMIIHKCENGSNYDIRNIPLEWIDEFGRLWLFKNIFCVLCHGMDLEIPSLEKWKVEFFCEKTVKTANDLPSGVFNLYHPGPDCYLKLRPPSLISKYQQRKCQGANIIETTCPSIPNLLSYKEFCDSYVYPVTNNKIVYRNPHCTACYNASMNYYVDCSGGDRHENSERAVDLKLLFDFNPSTGYTVTATCQQLKTCLSFEMYDCISYQCRNLYCPTNQRAYFGECVASNWTDGDNHWHEVTLPLDSENPLTGIVFVQIDVVSPNPIPIEEFTEYLRMSKFVEEIYKISEEEEMINLDTDEPYTEEEFAEHDSDWDVGDSPRSNEGRFENLNDFARDETTDKTDNDAQIDGRSDAVVDNSVTYPHRDIDSTESNSDQNTGNPKTDFDSSQPIKYWTTNSPGNEMKTDERMTESSEPQRTEGNDESGDPEWDIDKRNGNTDEHFQSDEPINRVNRAVPDPVRRNTQFLFIYTATVIVNGHTTTAANDLLKILKHQIENSDRFTITNLKINVRSYSDLHNLHCDNGNLTVLYNVSYLKDMTEIIIKTQTKTSVKNIFWTLSAETFERKIFDTIAVCLSRHQIPNLNCSFTVYEKDEVSFLNNSMYVKNTSLAFEQTEYEMTGSKIFVCTDKLANPTYLRFFNYSKLQRILSIVTSCISLVCLLSICVMHVLFPKLRNNHGLNLFALSTSMLLVQIMLLFENVPAGDICLFYAVCLHFLVLNMFVWMNVIGIDMAITFHSKTITKMANTGRFLKYCLVSILIPLVCIGICLILDVSHAQFGPDYGAEGICWLTNSGSIIIFFTVPIFLSISINFILFSIVLYSIQVTKIKTSIRTNVRNRTYSLVYFKMSIILGFTWVVGIIAAFVSVEWLWYVHIVLNGLQGLSLFLCSMVNARTVRVLKERTQTITFSDTKSSRVGN